MPAAVQTRSRQNRVKYAKKFLLHATPHFRCYHGSRLPPRAFEGMWKHSKFFSSGIKSARKKPLKRPSKAGKVPELLKKTLKKAPAKRGKRGVLKTTRVGRKKDVIVSLKPKKHVSFGKQMIGKRIAQEEQLYEKGVIGQYGGVPEGPLPREPTEKDIRTRYYGSRGDRRERMFRMDARGRLSQVARPARRIRLM